jgi:hypothetical protein
LSISHRIAERSTASLVVWDLDGSRGPVLEGMPIRILDPDSSIAFDGYVSVPEGSMPSPDDTPTRWSLDCVDYHYLADKRVIADGFLTTPAGTIVTSIITQVLSEEGITAGTIEAGPTLSEVVFNYVPCTLALDRLAEAAGKTWWIDESKALHFKAPLGTPVATIVLADHKEAPLVRHTSPDYRNRQIIAGAKDYTDAQTEDFEGDGTLQSFVTAYPIGKVPTVTLNAGGQTVGIRGLDTDKDWYWSKGQNVLSQESTDTPIASTDALQIVYQGLFELVAILNDDAEQLRLGTIEGSPSTGIVEGVLQTTDIFGRAAAFDAGSGLLATFSQEGIEVGVVTDRTDLAVGDYVTLELPEMDLASEVFLLVSIDSQDLSRVEWNYDVALVQGADAGSWQARLAQGLIDSDVLVIRENISEQETITFLVQTDEAWSWAETDVTVTVAACPIPSTSLNPSTSLLPC